MDTWLIWNMTKGEKFVTDYTNASRTMLYNIKELKWDEKILKEMNIPASMLPEVKPSSEVYGHTHEKHLVEHRFLLLVSQVTNKLHFLDKLVMSQVWLRTHMVLVVSCS